jgi:ABC-type microcin C transport system permease subunit YejE
MRSNHHSRQTRRLQFRSETLAAAIVASVVLFCTLQALLYPFAGKPDWWQSRFLAFCGLLLGLPVVLIINVIPSFPQPIYLLVLVASAFVWSGLCFVLCRWLLREIKDAEQMDAPEPRDNAA